MSKLKFISGTPFQEQIFEVLLKFKVGQKVYFIQDNEITTDEIEEIDTHIILSSQADLVQEIIYNLKNVGHKTEEELFPSLDSFPVKDLTEEEIKITKEENNPFDINIDDVLENNRSEDEIEEQQGLPF